MDMIIGAMIAMLFFILGVVIQDYVNNKANDISNFKAAKETRTLRDTINNQEVQIELLKEQLLEAKGQTSESPSDIFRIKHGAKKGLLSYKKASER